jgi:hypothetical protein
MHTMLCHTLSEWATLVRLWRLFVGATTLAPSCRVVATIEKRDNDTTPPRSHDILHNVLPAVSGGSQRRSRSCDVVWDIP